ncbi:unnamed protein product [Parajaminaea phylloscopi]
MDSNTMSPSVASVYLGAGFAGDTLTDVYTGKSRHGVARVCGHHREIALATIADWDGGSLHYSRFARCDLVEDLVFMQLPDTIDQQESDAILAVWEWVLCWALGPYQLNKKLMRVRGDYGLPQLPGVRGLNATPCLEGPADGKNRTFNQVGIVDAEYWALKARLNTLLALERAAKIECKPPPVKPATMSTIKTKLADRVAVLLLAGKLNWRVNIESVEWPFFGWDLPKVVRDGLKALVPVEISRPIFSFRLRESTPHVETDLVLAGQEEDMARMRGVVLEAGYCNPTVVDASYPAKVQMIRIDWATNFQALCERLLGALPQESRERRQAAFDACVADIEARKPAHLASLSQSLSRFSEGLCQKQSILAGCEAFMAATRGIVLEARYYDDLAKTSYPFKVQMIRIGGATHFREVAQIAVAGELRISSFLHVFVGGHLIQTSRPTFADEGEEQKRISELMDHGSALFTAKEKPQILARIVTGGQGLYDFDNSVGYTAQWDL